MDDLQCDGSETDISNCRFAGWGSNNCGHGQDVSVACSKFCFPSPMNIFKNDRCRTIS